MISAAAMTMTADVDAGTIWAVDNVHSNVKFSVAHLVISEVEGSFKMYEGTVEAARPDFTDASIEFTVDINSINTDNEGRDKHLKSDDFFNTEKYPKAHFKSSSFKKLDDRNYTLEGNLTMRGVTKPVIFAVTYGGTMKDPYGNTRSGFKATTVINRFDFGLKWNALTEAGGAMVGKDVTLTLNLELVQKQSL